MKTNVLILKTTAYIFHWSHDNVYYSHMRETIYAYRKALKRLYDATEENRTFHYVIDSNCTPVVNIDGLDVTCNDMMIQHIDGDFGRCDIINHQARPDVTQLDGTLWKQFGHGWARSNKFASLSIDTYPDYGLGYSQISFNGKNVRFNISDGKMYLFGHKYEEMNIARMYSLLNAVSYRAKDEIRKAIHTLIKTVL